MVDKKKEDQFRRTLDRFLGQFADSNKMAEESEHFPQHIHIEPTNACNLRCIHCMQKKMTRKRGLMSWETYVKIIDEIAPLQGAITLDVQGEPTIHPRITDMVGYAKERGINVSLLTNATMLGPEMAERLVQLKLDRIVFSFDAIEADLYERIRKYAKFKPTLLNILRFIEINQKNGHPVYITMSIIREEATKDHLEKYKEYFYALPIDTIFVSDLLTMSGASETASEIDLADKQNIDRAEWPICRIPWECITVNWDGTVCPCPLDFNIIWPVGNVNEKTLHEIWNGDEYRDFRRAHLKRDYSVVEKKDKLCSECNCLWDPEYDMRNYKDYIRETIIRQSKRFLRGTCDENERNDTLHNDAIQKLKQEIGSLICDDGLYQQGKKC